MRLISDGKRGILLSPYSALFGCPSRGCGGYERKYDPVRYLIVNPVVDAVGMIEPMLYDAFREMVHGVIYDGEAT
jgi:hypothetical protein